MEFNELALFAGGGGGLLGSKLLGWRTICYVENDDYAIEILKARIRDGMLDDSPIWDDVRTFDGKPWAGSVDIVTAGFPCQPWSLSGKRLGEQDERNLWPDTIRIIREVKPEWVLLENPPGILSKPYIQQIFGELAESGYDTRWDCIPAAAVGAPHLRYRVWIIAYTVSPRNVSMEMERQSFKENIDSFGEIEVISDIECQRCEERRLPVREKKENPVPGSYPILSDPDSNKLEESRDILSKFGFAKENWWSIEPGMGRMVHGLPHRVDRIEALGNGQVPAVVRAAWKLLGGDE